MHTTETRTQNYEVILSISSRSVKPDVSATSEVGL